MIDKTIEEKKIFSQINLNINFNKYFTKNKRMHTKWF